MAHNKLNKSQQLERERRAWELSCHGVSQGRIAAELGCSQATVSRILARVFAREREEFARDVAMERALASARLEHLYDEAMQAWERSKLPKKRASRRTATEGQGGGKSIDTVEQAERCGDVRWLDAAMAIWTRYVEFWGLNAAPKLPVEEDGREASVSGIALKLVAARRGFEARKGTA